MGLAAIVRDGNVRASYSELPSDNINGNGSESGKGDFSNNVSSVVNSNEDKTSIKNQNSCNFSSSKLYDALSGGITILTESVSAMIMPQQAETPYAVELEEIRSVGGELDKMVQEQKDSHYITCRQQPLLNFNRKKTFAVAMTALTTLGFAGGYFISEIRSGDNNGKAQPGNLNPDISSDLNNVFFQESDTLLPYSAYQAEQHEELVTQAQGTRSKRIAYNYDSFLNYVDRLPQGSSKRLLDRAVANKNENINIEPPKNNDEKDFLNLYHAVEYFADATYAEARTLPEEELSDRKKVLTHINKIFTNLAVPEKYQSRFQAVEKKVSLLTCESPSVGEKTGPESKGTSVLVKEDTSSQTATYEDLSLIIQYFEGDIKNEKIKSLFTNIVERVSINKKFTIESEADSQNYRKFLEMRVEMKKFLSENKRTLSTEENKEGKKVLRKMERLADKLGIPGKISAETSNMSLKYEADLTREFPGIRNKSFIISTEDETAIAAPVPYLPREDLVMHPSIEIDESYSNISDYLDELHKGIKNGKAKKMFDASIKSAHKKTKDISGTNNRHFAQALETAREMLSKLEKDGNILTRSEIESGVETLRVLGHEMEKRGFPIEFSDKVIGTLTRFRKLYADTYPAQNK
ncbi:hypothetical protein ABW286_02140 [Erwinia papayae]|uniref:Uncharacterized protein n=1 Tax=Erwinia papayae TaxID=206499 RepID=A0ABV3MWV5_9GAMM